MLVTTCGGMPHQTELSSAYFIILASAAEKALNSPQASGAGRLVRARGADCRAPSCWRRRAVCMNSCDAGRLLLRLLRRRAAGPAAQRGRLRRTPRRQRQARGDQQCPAQVHEQVLSRSRRIIQAAVQPVRYNKPANTSGRRQSRQIRPPRQEPEGWRKPACQRRVSDEAMPNYDFRTPRVYLDAPLAAGQTASRSTATRPITWSTCCGSSTATSCCCSTAATANGRPRSPAPANARVAVDRRARVREQPRAVRPAFPVRPAQARPARLSGAEGGGDGRVAPAAGDHAAHAGRAASISIACAPMRSRRRSSAAS